VIALRPLEWVWIEQALRHYPLCPGPPSPAAGSDPALLRELLEENARTNRARLDRLLRQRPRHPAREGEPVRLELGPEEAEWLLEILNDVRVGSWHRLGSPEHPESLPARLTGPQAILSMLIRITGRLQMHLLRALEQLDSPGPAEKS
jgi:hypothetical protein